MECQWGVDGVLMGYRGGIDGCVECEIDALTELNRPCEIDGCIWGADGV